MNVQRKPISLDCAKAVSDQATRWLGWATFLSLSTGICLGLPGRATAQTEPAQVGEPQGESRTERPPGAPVILRLVVDGPLTLATHDYVLNGIEEAEQIRASAVIIELDTPGGLLEATRRVVQGILDARVPVVVFVTPRGARAGSAGLFLALAAHVAAMAPTTHLGAAHPVSLFGKDVEGEMERKIVNDTVAWARSLAQTHDRNAEWAEKAVRESASISEQEALEQNVVDLVAEDLDDLLERINDRKVKVAGQVVAMATAGARVKTVHIGGKERFVNALADPNLLYLLLLVGLFLVFLEFKNPGLIVPGVVGALLLLLVLGLQILPLNWLGVLLIVGAAALFVAEIYVTSFGLLTAGGVACLIAGSYLLFDVPGLTLRIAPHVIWSVALTFTTLMLLVGFLLVRAKRQGATSGVDGMVGEVAVVYHEIRPEEAGKIAARGAYWTAASRHVLQAGAKVRVTAMNGTQAEVEPLEGERARPPAPQASQQEK